MFLGQPHRPGQLAFLSLYVYAGAIQNRNHETERKAICLRVTILVGNDKKDGNKDREGLSDFWQSFCGLLCLRGDLRSGSQEID